MAYLLDANVFIESRNRFYGFDICPGFWEWLDAAHAKEKVFSIEKVSDELVDDDLAAWAKDRSGLFLRPDADVVKSLQATSTWATSQDYDAAAVTTFLESADYYLVAHAHAHGYVVVTQEVIANTRKKIKIPNACIGMGVKCLGIFDMLRAEKARFVLDAT
ncbi:MAG: DUF4411 family protein [Actinobacteria bacterium]|nr:DUF4411 family protein [Actinomycetota bacterium]